MAVIVRIKRKGSRPTLPNLERYISTALLGSADPSTIIFLLELRFSTRNLSQVGYDEAIL